MFMDACVLSPGLQMTKAGYLHVNARVARAGVQVYQGAELDRPDLRQVAVYRDPAEVFARDSLHSFANLPITLDHPPAPVTATSWRNLAVGTTGEEVLRDGEYLKIGLRVTDSAAIAAIQAGKRQLSVGYAADLLWGDGLSADGQPYQARQTRIRANHVALVDVARAGPDAALPHFSTPKKESAMTHIPLTIDGKTVTLSDSDAAVVQAALTTREQQAARLEGERDAAQAELQQKLKAESFEAIEALVAARATLIAQASALAPELETKGLSDPEIRKAVVEAKGVPIADKSPAYIEARFDALFDALPTRLAARVVADPVGRHTAPALGTARDTYLTHLSTAWKGTAQ